MNGPTGIQLRHYAMHIRHLRGWTQDALATQLTAAGFPTNAASVRNREVRESPMSIDEALAFAAALGIPGIDALIATMQAPCEQCAGTPPKGFSCTACGATTT